MSNQKQFVLALPALKSRRASSGFSLIELMIAMAIFMVVGGAAVSLVNKHEVLFTKSQNQAGVNIALRNSIAQIQTDVVNAGSGYYPGSNMPFWPVGITATGTPGDDAACKASGVWVPACFDTLTVLTADPSVPAGQPSANPDGSGVFNVGVNTTLYLTFNISANPPLTAPQLTTLLNTWAPKYAPGTEILLVQSDTSTPQILPLVVGAAGASVTANNTLSVQVSAAPTDNLGIMDAGDNSLFTTLAFGPAIAPKLLTDPPGPRDYVIRLDATKYSVNAANQLVRLAPNSIIPDPIANNIVGFQVQEFANGTWGKLAVPADWSQIRAVQVTLVARTPSKGDPTTGFQNSYDKGSYQVEGISVVVNPRNLSM
jgi:prepilin-type N-terminal cleavage/methylation domain-containing protein